MPSDPRPFSLAGPGGGGPLLLSEQRSKSFDLLGKHRFSACEGGPGTLLKPLGRAHPAVGSVPLPGAVFPLTSTTRADPHRPRACPPASSRPAPCGPPPYPRLPWAVAAFPAARPAPRSSSFLPRAPPRLPSLHRFPRLLRGCQAGAPASVSAGGTGNFQPRKSASSAV